jgi:hypothetical protein
VVALCSRNVDEAVSWQDYSKARDVAADETSRAGGDTKVTLFADVASGGLTPARPADTCRPHIGSSKCRRKGGSGYLIIDRLVLTAWHVLRPEHPGDTTPSTVQVRLEGRIHPYSQHA